MRRVARVAKHTCLHTWQSIRHPKLLFRRFCYVITSIIDARDQYASLPLVPSGNHPTALPYTLKADTKLGCLIQLINVKNFHGSLTTVVMGQNDTS